MNILSYYLLIGLVVAFLWARKFKTSVERPSGLLGWGIVVCLWPMTINKLFKG